jgi:hypothetical protein
MLVPESAREGYFRTIGNRVGVGAALAQNGGNSWPYHVPKSQRPSSPSYPSRPCQYPPGVLTTGC